MSMQEQVHSIQTLLNPFPLHTSLHGTTLNPDLAPLARNVPAAKQHGWCHALCIHGYWAHLPCGIHSLIHSHVCRSGLGQIIRGAQKNTCPTHQTVPPTATGQYCQRLFNTSVHRMTQTQTQGLIRADSLIDKVWTVDESGNTCKVTHASILSCSACADIVIICSWFQTNLILAHVSTALHNQPSVQATVTEPRHWC